MITIFSITNGRSTHEYSYRSLKECYGVEDIIVVKNMDFSDSLQYCIDNCKTKFFLKADDDFIFHPKSFLYMKYCIECKKNDNLGYYHWKLYEDFSKKIVHCIKIYQLQAIKEIGGFKFKECGKADRATKEALMSHGFKIIDDKSILAIHATGTKEEQIKYNELWKNNAKNPNKYKKGRYEYMLKYKKSVKYQYELKDKFLKKLNKKKDTRFWKWMNSE